MRNNARGLLIKTAITLLVIAIVGYGIFAARDLIRGPSIEISEPADGFSTASSTVLVTGRALRVQKLSLNGASVAISLEGDFKERILLQPGMNPVLAKANDKFGRNTEVFIQIIRKDPEIKDSEI